VHAPAEVSLDALLRLHHRDYVEAMLSGSGALARTPYLPWSPGLVSACRHMLGGQLAAARRALADGCAVNIACGFHHAHPDRGGGYCVFNGLAHVAAELADLTVCVLDCDEHGGDGTEAFCGQLPNLEAISIFGSRFGIRGQPRSRALAVPRSDDEPSDAAFLGALDQALDSIVRRRPDLVLYQASTDSHIDDPKSTLRLTTETLATRDQRVLRLLAGTGIPVVISFAGGYQSAERVAVLQCHTLEIACRVFG
jgi:acetoin utilization deacetylase AcuC-like enzyme